jgi:transcription elongation factor Elf1
MAIHAKGKTKRGKHAQKFKKENKEPIKQNGKKDTCYFCKKEGHMKKDCQKYIKWLERKGNLICPVCHESFFVEAPNNTWWIDSGSIIHIVSSMQGFLTTRRLASNERVYSGNKLFSLVEAVGTFRIILKSGYVLDLENVFFIP